MDLIRQVYEQVFPILFVCGRFSRFTGPDIIEDYFSVEINLADFAPKYNIAPSANVGVIYQENPIIARNMQWGIVPFYEKDARKPAHAPINAKSETVLEKNMFKYSFEKRRCIIPADGFYEWKKVAGVPQKVPYFIYLIENDEHLPMGLAGIYSTWYPEILDEKEKQSIDPVYSFAILTTSPNDVMADIHDRMPVILDPSNFGTWIDPNTTTTTALELCTPYSGRMNAYPVSTYVNSPNNDDAYCIKPSNDPFKEKDQDRLDDYF